MAIFEVYGGRPLSGEITPQGAKNEALQIICATLLTDQKVVLHNVPEILDVMRLIDLLRNLGVEVEHLGEGEFSFRAANIDLGYLKTEDYRVRGSKLRGSVMVIGPLLARFGLAYIPKPGGDKIGRRRLDTHFIGFQKLGASINVDPAGDFFEVDARRLKGTYMLLDEASVTGTANIIMAAVLAEGTTTIYNAACEPYIQQLCKMLCRMGAKIEGIASNLLRIEGVKQLGGTEHTMLPDMIEVGSFIGMAAMTQSELTIKDVSFENLGIIPAQFERMGIRFEQRGDDIFIPRQEHYEIESFMDGSIMSIADAPWPGLTPDLLSVFLVVATQAKGSVLIHQKMFESRLFFVDKLIDMGAQVILCDPHRATVIGHNHQRRLRPTTMASPDIRAGVALLLAALNADGKSVIQNIEQIDRGYQNIDGRLNALGAKIIRKE
ncbi:MAG: UDP-N-acetylglucosamine 1-carboxyvinyltransferase [Tidjanibacter sp.]|nr:UDP-N-acetylglucosamine 1-carboxyvinyltransferase [Tidjanibacter sp.]MBR3682034.1 UDP-N-acetylglucosamine 1-carboxyvinyltransferase [Tidjanibacter sp.]MBR4037917.1 UDP-N-acetylglucosamine 1-carboxyvinyltransferase [Tidjanibacter sp.]MBR7130235.1 UDP-N-acetylglucosamine 1-carboxyvinyltransferase [Tidjanibacter sp.]